MTGDNVLERAYRKYTDYDKEPSGFLRLDRIVDTLEKHFGSGDTSKVNVLEVGCGTGNICRAVASLGYHVTGVDIDANSIRTAKANNLLSNLKFETRDACGLSVTNEFDAVICSEVFEHLKKPLKLLRAIHDLLKPEGLLLATVPNGYGPEEIARRFLLTTDLGRKLRMILQKKILIHDVVQTENFESPHVQYFSCGRFKALIEHSGFEIIRICNWTAFFLQAYYLFLRLIIKRGDSTFRRLDEWDRALARHWPLSLGGGWFIEARRLA